MRRMTSHLIASALLFLSLAQSPAPDPQAKVDEIFNALAAPGSPGCTAGVCQDGKMSLGRAYGMPTREHDVRRAPSSVFHRASVSKQCTAASILLLAQDGKLSLDDDSRKHLPEMPDFG